MNESYGGEIEHQGVVKPYQQQQSGMEDDDNLVLWVGNLDSRTTENMIYELFCQAGPILYIRLPKNPDGQGHKGYCFVTFQHEASVPYAMNVMEGTTLFGKKLKLQPRPGSVHRKLMDQKKAEQRQEVFQQPQPQQLAQQPQQQQQQWFAHPQMAQVPPNMFVYQNQLYQSFSPNPNVNMNVMAIPFQPTQMGTQFVQLPVQQTPPATSMQQPQSRGPPGGNYVSGGPPRTPVLQNGYNAQYIPAGMPQQQQIRASTASPQQPAGGGGNPSHFNNHQNQGMNSQPYQPRAHFQNPRGGGGSTTRPQRNGYANGSVVNNNSRMPYHQPRMSGAGGGGAGQQQPPTYMMNPQQGFQGGQTVQLVQSPDYRRTNTAPQQQQAFPPGTVPGQNYGNPAAAANGFHNVHVYHY